jgi:hypothetical protein
MEVEDADLLRVDNGPYGLEAGAVVGLLVFPVLHELARQDVLLELDARDEVVVGAVGLVLAPRARGVGNGRGKPRCVAHQPLAQLVPANVGRTCEHNFVLQQL